MLDEEDLKMTNIYASAHEVEKAVRRSEEFSALKNAYEALKLDKEAFTQFKELQKNQIELRKKQFTGDIDGKDLVEFQEEVKKAARFPSLMKLESKEKALAEIVDELNGIMFKPIHELYQDKG
ncbi:hypothetical protein FD46_GL001910 [Liquorilactobacillus oeni DSM 19972]|uniref:Uncharacterized protein n=2 Tax=Liquorilactobacillus oeni TaxID=303241 RepID=A0A0R1MHK4_9LACO|nr:hypothetical protein FD46_GL001910 [Liquorilactobacillus oeni DSM 19972]